MSDWSNDFLEKFNAVWKCDRLIDWNDQSKERLTVLHNFGYRKDAAIIAICKKHCTKSSVFLKTLGLGLNRKTNRNCLWIYKKEKKCEEHSNVPMLPH